MGLAATNGQLVPTGCDGILIGCRLRLNAKETAVYARSELLIPPSHWDGAEVQQFDVKVSPNHGE